MVQCTITNFILLYIYDKNSMNDADNKDSKQSYISTLNRRMAIFSLKSIKNPIEIKLRNNKIATGILHSLDPTTLDIIVSNFMING